jgi:ABC-2 type transport system permease protein
MNWEVPIMQSKTSFFNGRIYRTTLARFWPLWGAYAMIMFIITTLPMMGRYASENAQSLTTNQLLQNGWNAGCIASVIMAAATAMCVFGYLYNARHTGMMAALPVKRGAMYTSVFAGGLTAMLASDVLVFLTALLAEAGIDAVNMSYLLQWLAIIVMMNVTFYGFAAFCAMLTGSLAVLPLVYAVLEVVVYVVEQLVHGLLQLFVFGMSSGSDALTFLSPPIKLIAMQPGTFVVGDTGIAFAYITNGQWLLLGCYCAAGIAFAVLGLLLYRARRMETASDVVAVGVLRPVFKYCLAGGCALVLGLWLFNIIYGSSAPGVTEFCVLLLLMMAGAFIGYFAADMLMKKTFRVFSDNWKGYIILCCVIAALMLCCRYDVTGYEKRVPDASSVESVTIQASGSSATLTDSKDIAAAIELQQGIISRRDYYESGISDVSGAGDNGYGYIYATFSYALKSGGFISRSYDLLYTDKDFDTPGSDMMKLQALINTQSAIEDRKKVALPVTADNIRYSTISYFDKAAGGYKNYDLTPEQAEQLYKECILPDIKSGAMGRVWLYSGSQDYLSKVYALNIEIDIYDSTKASNYDQALNDGKSSAVAADDQYFSTTLTADAVNTLKWIKDNTGIVPVMEKDSGMDVGKTEAAVNGGTYYEG